MKRALISLIEIGRVCEVVEQGREFETTSDFKWVDCPDDVLTSHTYDESTNTFTPHNPLAIPGFVEEGYRVARQIAYKSVGEQMDMMFKELAATGTIAPDGPWASHVAQVKATIPKDDPAAVMEWNKQHAATLAAATVAAPAPVTEPTSQNLPT
jgi:hypothetical protein